MSEIIVDKNKNEMNLFKNEILGLIYDLEKKLNTKIKQNHSKLIEDLESYEAKISALINNDKDMVISLVTQKLKLEKIAELESFKNKVEDMIITHELRIKNNLDDISRIKLKYDKIISENLYVSGFIGNSCQFKNLSEYLSYNISEVSKLKIEKEQLKKDIRDLKLKYDGLMKNMITLNDNSVRLCKNYTDNKQNEFHKIIENNEKELNQKHVENKALICQFQKNAEENEKKHKEEFNKLIDMKQDFINIIDDKFVEIKKFHDQLNKRVINNNLDIDIHKKKFEKINEEIKDLNQYQKDISFQIRNYYCANNKILNIIDKLEKINPKQTYSEISKIVQIKNEINQANNINNSISPKRKIGNKQNLTKSAFNFKPNSEDALTIKKNNNITKSFLKNRQLFNKKAETSESESSLSINNINEIKGNNGNDKKENNKENNINNNELMINKKINTSILDISKNKININENNNILPSIIKNYKEESILDENKKINLSVENNKSAIIKEKDNNEINENKIKIKKKNIINLINNDYENEINKIKINHKKEIIINKRDYQLEQDTQACKLVTLTLPSPLKENFITKRDKIKKNKFKNDVMNSLINSYRAKLFYKAHSPDEKNEITNELLDIPKKVGQAFGRTTYTFYFRKDQINNNINKHNNNFCSSNSKRNHKDIKTIIRDDTGQ